MIIIIIFSNDILKLKSSADIWEIFRYKKCFLKATSTKIPLKGKLSILCQHSKFKKVHYLPKKIILNLLFFKHKIKEKIFLIKLFHVLSLSREI